MWHLYFIFYIPCFFYLSFQFLGNQTNIHTRKFQNNKSNDNFQLKYPQMAQFKQTKRITCMSKIHPTTLCEGCNFIYLFFKYVICRDNWPKNICWALALFEKAQWFENISILGKTWDFELPEPCSYDCRGRSKRSITSAKRRRGQKVSSIIQWRSRKFY